MRDPDVLRHNPEVSLAALEALHEPLFGWAMSRCAYDRSMAEDLMQETYVQLISGKARFRGDAALKTFAFSVVQKLANSRFRRRATRMRLLEDVGRHFDEAVLPGMPDDSVKVWRAVGQLPARQKDVIELVFCRDFSVQEAASVMGVTVGTARVHYDRAKKTLQAMLRDFRSEAQ